MTFADYYADLNCCKVYRFSGLMWNVLPIVLPFDEYGLVI
jgi:hypothetical protein